MICHERLVSGVHQVATALCRFCFVALCKPHLMELHRELPTFPQYTCHHAPAQPIRLDVSSAPGGARRRRSNAHRS
jgi:hypothetical protein